VSHPRFRRGSLACAVAVCVILPSAARPARAAEHLYDGIAAQVGSSVVLISEVNQMAAPVEARMRQAGVPDGEIQRMRADVLDRLIETRLIEDVVHRLELEATDREVDTAIQSIAADAGITIEQLQQSVTGHGLTLEEYREKIRSEIERSKVINTMVRSRVRVEPEEVEALYYQHFGNQPVGGEEIHLRHILVASAPQADRDRATACKIASEGAARIASGEADFAAVAAEISDASPGTGGDMGWIHSRDLAEWMTIAIENLEAGQVSSVIETPFGCNLLQVVERRKFEPMTFDQAKPRLENMLLRQKMEEEYTKWVETLRSKTYIEKKPGFVSTGDAG